MGESRKIIEAADWELTLSPYVLRENNSLPLRRLAVQFNDRSVLTLPLLFFSNSSSSNLYVTFSNDLLTAKAAPVCLKRDSWEFAIEKEIFRMRNKLWNAKLEMSTTMF